MAAIKQVLLVVFLAANVLIIFMCTYVSNVGHEAQYNFDRTVIPTHSADDSADVISGIRHILESGNSETTEETKTLFNSGLVYNTTKAIHDHLYNLPVNQTCKRQYPACILLGVYKCGTRELMDFFSIHPNVQIKRNPYEFGYFMSMKYRNNPTGLNWYRQQLPCIYDDQVSMTKHAGYFADPRVPERIYKANNDTKLILMVRDPVQRFISHVWFQNKKLSLSDLIELIHTTLKMELIKRGKRFAGSRPGVNENKQYNANTNAANVRSNFSQYRRKLRGSVLPGSLGISHPRLRSSTLQRLLKYSVYDEPYVRYMKYFKKDQLLVIESDEFKKNPAAVLYKLETFLDIPHRIQRDMFVYNSQKKYFCIKSLNGTQICYDDRRGHDYKMDIDHVTKNKLRDFFRPHNERFFSLIGKRFDDWNK